MKRMRLTLLGLTQRIECLALLGLTQRIESLRSGTEHVRSFSATFVRMGRYHDECIPTAVGGACVSEDETPCRVRLQGRLAEARVLSERELREL